MQQPALPEQPCTDLMAWMAFALELAAQAAQCGEVPVGAVVVSPQGHALGWAHNRVCAQNDGTAHAELLALQQAAQAYGDRRLAGCTLLVTLEPCLQCAGAARLARVARVVYAAADPAEGALGGHFNAYDGLPGCPEVYGGLMAQQAGQLLSTTFKRLRGQ